MAKIVTINGVGDIDLDKIAKLLPGRNSWDILQLGTQGRYIKAIIDSWPTLERYDIYTPLRLGHFFGQGLVETGWLKYTEEGFSYSAEGLVKTFRFYRRNPELAKQHARKPELIANTVYANRMGNGNIESGDGWRHRGMGLKQLTGKDNQKRCGDALGMDFIKNPELLLTPEGASLSAAWFWSVNKCGPIADSGDFVALTKKINGGTIGLEDRQKRYKAVLAV